MSFKVNFKNIQLYGVQEEDLEKMYNQGYEIGNSQGYSNGYNEGYQNGEQIGLENGIEQGEKLEYDRFWDSFQKKGSPSINFDYFFAGQGWNDETFRPKYDIVNPYGRSMRGLFAYSNITNLKKILQDCGVVLDTGKSYAVNNMFMGATKITHIPYLDFGDEEELKSASTGQMFWDCQDLEIIDGINLGADEEIGIRISADAFDYCYKLKHCVFEGVIRRIDNNGFSMKSCKKLDKESIESVINCLSSLLNAKKATLSLQAVDKAFETSENANDGSTSSEWLNLINTKSNWTIILA